MGDFLSDGAFLIKYTRMLVSAGLIAVCSVDARALTVGDWVLGNNQGAGYWFPGVVEKIGADKVTIRYDDGDRETVAVGAVRPYDWMIGMSVECNYKGAGDWYPGTIASLGRKDRDRL